MCGNGDIPNDMEGTKVVKNVAPALPERPPAEITTLPSYDQSYNTLFTEPMISLSTDEDDATDSRMNPDDQLQPDWGNMFGQKKHDSEAQQLVNWWWCCTINNCVSIVSCINIFDFSWSLILPGY